MRPILTILCILISYTLHAQAPQWIVYNTGNSGLPSNGISTISVDSNNVVWIGTGYGLVRYYNNNWTVYDTNNSGIHGNSIFSLGIDANNNLWMGSISGIPGGLSKFDVINWTVYNQQNSGLPSANVTDIDFDSKGNVWLATTKGLAKFDGLNWTIFNDTNSILPTNILTTIEIQGDTIWVGTQSSGVVKYDGINWVLYNTQNSGLPHNSIYLGNTIRIDSFNNTWIGTHGGGLAKFDGINWATYTPQNSGIPSGSIISLNLTGNQIWVGTINAGLAKFVDELTWEVFSDTNSPMPSNYVTSIAVDSLGNKWIGTPHGLVVYNENGIVNINNTISSIPQDFNLYQNYPNPFNPSTKIKFSVSKRELINIKVYNIQGRHISTILNEQKNPGSYEVEFNGEGLPSGVYFYKLEAEDFIQTKRMVLLK